MRTLVCKQNYYHPSNFNLLFKEGQRYDIEMINNHLFYLSVLNINYDMSDYFISIKEERKLKLERIANETCKV